MSEEPIRDAESLAEEPQSFDPQGAEDTDIEATIVYEDGSEVVDDFFALEEIGAFEPVGTIRVWYSDPEEDSTDYVDYENGTITFVRA